MNIQIAFSYPQLLMAGNEMMSQVGAQPSHLIYYGRGGCSHGMIYLRDTSVAMYRSTDITMVSYNAYRELEQSQYSVDIIQLSTPSIPVSIHW